MVDPTDARLQIRCSTPELHRHAQQSRAKPTKSATPVATPDHLDEWASTKPDAARKGPRQRGPDSRHSRLTADYVARNPGTETKRFVAAVRAVAERCKWFNVDFAGPRRAAIDDAFPLGFLPDAFRVDRKAKAITIVEAEVTHRITAYKWRRIADLYWHFREDDWDVGVHTIDTRGIVFSVDVPLIAVQLDMDYPAEEVAIRPPGSVIWQPTDGERPVREHRWHDALQRALGQWEDEGQPVPPELQRKVRSGSARITKTLAEVSP